MNDVPKNCVNCPSLLTEPSDQVALLQKNVGAPVCARFGKVLGSRTSSKADIKELGKIYAKDCDKFGASRPNVAPWSMLELRVAIPDPDAMLNDNQRVTPRNVTTCRMCSNFIREDAASSELGYNAGVCAAKGKLILPQRMSYEADGCNYSSWGSVRTASGGLTMLPEYTQILRGDPDPIKNHMIQKSRAFVDPREYPTDKDVSDEDRECGIRAWR